MLSATKPRSSSSPIETKKVALKTICSGRISLSACWPKRLSWITSPARKAPSETLTPARLVRYAVPKQIAITVIRKISGEQVRATTSSNIGISRRAKIRIAAMIATATPSAPRISQIEPPEVPSAGTSRTIGMIARSWKSKQADAGVAVLLRALAAVLEQAEHERGRAQRDEQAGVDRGPDGDAEREQDHERQPGGQQHLQAAAAEDHPPQARQPLQAELHPDREQQQDHADVGGGVDHLAVVDDAKRVRADQDAGDQESDDRHQAETRAYEGDDRAADEQYRELREEVGGLAGGDQHPLQATDRSNSTDGGARAG